MIYPNEIIDGITSRWMLARKPFRTRIHLPRFRALCAKPVMGHLEFKEPGRACGGRSRAVAPSPSRLIGVSARHIIRH